VNHDGEGNPNWHRLPEGIFIARPEGDAGRAVIAMAHILKHNSATQAENWNTFKF
jgi:hypothetical protein